MFCALLGQDIRWAFTGPLVLWFILGLVKLSEYPLLEKELG